MARWDPGAGDRLRQAALELYLERGYENVTVAEIAQHVGLTKRTFFRYFADKREVLFAGSERLPVAVADAIRGADAALAPIDAMLHGLTVGGNALTELGPRARAHRAVIATSPELQERERTKLAALTAGIADALMARGVGDGTAELVAQAGVAILATAFGRWLDLAGDAEVAELLHDAFTELRTALAAGRGASWAAAGPCGEGAAERSPRPAVTPRSV